MHASRSRSRALVSALFALTLAGVGIAAVVWLRPPAPPPLVPAQGAPVEPVEPERLSMPLTGVMTEAVPERAALVVKVSNSPEARPQAGLEFADLVFEELTEGGVTRFVAVIHSQLPEVIGPVRSARPVDAQIVSGFGHPGFAFSGARPEVRVLLAAAPAVTITEGAPGFFRDAGTYASHPFAPHDLFLRVEDGLAAVEAGAARSLADIGWEFSDEPPAGGVDATQLEVAMSHAYRTGWTYDAGSYRRAQNGVEHETTGVGSVRAANVVVLEVRHYVGPSSYPETDILGTGDAIVLRDGLRYEARWTKPSPTAPLLLLDADGGRFPLARGPTWLMLPAQLPQ